MNQPQQKIRTRSENLADMEQYLRDRNNVDYKEGDYIERTKLGEMAYQFPRDNMVAVCVKIFDEMRIDEDGNPFDCILAANLPNGGVKLFAVDRALYRKSTEKKNVVKFWGRK